MARFVFLCIFWVIAACRVSPVFSQAGDIDRNVRLIASRYGVEHPYKTGYRLCIKYQKDNREVKVRGFFSGATDGNIILRPNKTVDYNIIIHPEDIIYVRRIKPLNRVIAGSGALALMGAGVLIIESAANGMAAGLAGIPLAAVGYVLLYYIPVSLIIEKIMEKKRSHGWKFQLRKAGSG